ncbi:hypothetical protein JG688_00007011 [Phytophthora aleatoria]|uniref:Uncharacterized protein n=1 Tax=Phytophthora aleatoria TaxID=2496075 RepID=A0A8J5J6K7_9STRA|nr:hypothetical protein JG688_00007011 [Phytophthora aleatoria]
MKPLWTGKTRWSQYRRSLKERIARKRRVKGMEGSKRVQEKWENQHGCIAQAVKQCSWKTLHTLAGVPGYQAQNLQDSGGTD